MMRGLNLTVPRNSLAVPIGRGHLPAKTNCCFSCIDSSSATTKSCVSVSLTSFKVTMISWRSSLTPAMRTRKRYRGEQQQDN